MKETVKCLRLVLRVLKTLVTSYCIFVVLLMVWDLSFYSKEITLSLIMLRDSFLLFLIFYIIVEILHCSIKYQDCITIFIITLIRKLEKLLLAHK